MNELLGASEYVVKSSCRMCHGGCGVLVHVKDSDVVKVTGDPESPLSKGRLCRKGATSLELLYHPDRLKYPLRRLGERGQGRWERISWDEALDSIAGTLRRMIDERGVESIGIGQGTGRRHFDYVVRFANALGTPNWCEPGFAQCFIPRLNANLLTFGQNYVPDYYGEVNPQYILVWGHNPLVTGPDGEVQFTLRDCLKKGSCLIAVDPRKTETVEKAEIWLQLRPGTDDALALSMLNVIIGEGLYDRDFVEKWTSGFERLAERVEPHTPEWAEDITWVPADKIRLAARTFAEASPATLDWGVAFEHTPNCFQTARAIVMLPAVTGNIDVPGGFITGMLPMGLFPYLNERLSEDAKRKRLGAEEFKVLGGNGVALPVSSAHIPAMLRAMRTGDPYPITAFLVFGSNPLVSCANPREVRESLMELELLVVMDIFMTPTAELADIVLPAATWLEADGLQGYPIGVDLHILAQQKVVRLWESRQDEEVLIDLARRLGLAAGTESLEDLLEGRAKKLGFSFEELKQKGSVTPPLMYEKHEMMKMFIRPSRKIELYSDALEDLGYDPLPYYEEPPEGPRSTPELLDEYPFILITGGRIPYFFHTEHRQMPSLRRRHPDPLVQMHPETASRLGIQEGDWVWIETRRGKIQQKARITDGVDPRVVHVEHGWWFPEQPGPEHGLWKSNANLLTDNGPPYDPAMGTYQLRAMLCNVYKA